MAEKETQIIIMQAETATRLEIPLSDEAIRAGFPSPAQDYVSDTIDLNRDLISHPSSTFYGRVVGDSMINEGIEEGDILVIDKSLNAENGDLAVCCLDGEFTLKRIHLTRDRRLFLMPSNDKYPPIEVTPDNDFMVWGIVTYTIKANRRRRGSRI